ncbi:helix-turn-helix transcriptional regulator [Erwiniaceae bacterium BAC15a-03b]|uniref:Helix-turn-helix transcriptional regulator n=1 Tax=Winslowiella arboricola TaxID=2978220 RepID=A0A9J6PVS5_9GAMM|nr:LuxR C-terminal-related transcriptional regulator [Winslowiella arboricola]MCU5772402.1 helix-turn-helix transcriptional regulator [Winslowiella arboricola]MCU5779805.1 helix-turn-helix transcriptional regulator [Winslowiella arboricola]
MHFNDRLNHDDIISYTTITRSLDLLTEPYCIRTADGRFLYANMAMAKFSGLRSPYIMMERPDYEIPSLLFDDEENLEAWRQQDNIILETRKPLTMLEIHAGAVDSPYLCRKVPFYSNTDECIGTFCTIKYLEVFTPNDFIKGKLPESLLLNKPDDFFTEKQCEIIFYRLQGVSNKEISQILGLSPRTVENRMAQMYNKARVNHLDDFRKFCELRNLHRYLPKRVLLQRKSDYNEKIDSR